MPASTTGRPAAVLSILVTANTRSATAELAALNRQAAYSVKRTAAGAAAIQRSIVGLRFAAVGLGAATAGSVAAAIKFQSAFANVEKTVEGTPKQLARIRDGILDLSTEIPESANALAELAGEAGALGVKQKQLVRFTKTAAMLGTTTNLTADAAADALARLGNILEQRSPRAFKRMGSILVELGNKGASTEQEIAQMSLRIAGAGEQVGLAAPQVLGLAAALANVGIRAEMGGSAISRVMLAMQAAIAANGAELETWAETAGMSTDEFAKSFAKDVPGTIATFADGLNKIKKDGGAIAITLADLGKAAHTSMNDIRVRDTLNRIAGNTEQFRHAQKLANAESRDTNALTIEAGKRYATLESQLHMLGNSITRIGIDLGDQLLPNLTEMVEVLRNPDLTLPEKMEKVFDQLGDLIQEHGPTIAKMGGQIGIALARGIAGAFLHAGILGKLFIGASLIRLFGGPGSLLAAGTFIARPIIGGIQKAFMGTAFAGAMKAAIAGQMMQMGGTGPAWFSPSTVSPLGARLGKMIGFVTANAIPLGFAAAGIGNILQDAMGGDARGAAFEAGGGIAGAIVGGLVGGLPGALIGSGIGTIIGDFIGDSFSGQDFKHLGLGDLSDRLAKQAGRSAQALNEVARGAKEASREVREARQRDREATRKVTRAEEQLQQARQKYGPNSKQVVRAEHKVEDAKRDSIDASRDLRKAERLQGYAREHQKEQLKRTIGTQQASLETLKQERKELRQQYVQLTKQKAPWRERNAAYKEWTAKSKDVRKAQSAVNDTLAKAEKLIGPKFAKSLDKVAEKLGKQKQLTAAVAQVMENKLNRSMEEVAPTYQAAAARARDYDDRLAEIPGRARQIVQQALRPLQSETKQTGDEMHDSGKKGERAFDSLNGAVQRALKLIGGSTNKALKELGLDPVKFGVSKGQQSGGGHGPHRAMGGSVVPGHGSGDKVPLTAMVEPGEGVFVLNRNAMGYLQALNDQVPRFRTGGSVGGSGMIDPAGPGTGVVNPAIADVVGRWSTRYNAAINYGYDPGGGHLSPGHNITGTATDTGPAGGWTGSSLSLFERGLRAIENSVDQLLYGTAGIGTPYPNHGRGNHAHIEWGMHPDVQGMVAEMVKRVFINGPLGPLLDIGQSSLDTVVKAVNHKIQKEVGSSFGGDLGSIGAGGILSKQQIAGLWSATGGGGDPGLMAAIALAESSGDPHAHGPPDGRGLWQIEWPVWSSSLSKFGNPYDPRANARMAHQVLSQQGLGAWVVYNTGAYRQFLKEGGEVEATGAIPEISLPGVQTPGPGGYATGLAPEGVPGGPPGAPPGPGSGVPGSFRNIFNLKRFERRMLKAEGPGDRRSLISKAREQIKKRTQLGILDNSGSGLAGILQEVRDQADLAGENASFASSMTLDGGTPAKFQNQDEAGWLKTQLGHLLNLRNRLIVAEEKVAKGSKALKELMGKIRGPGGLLSDIADRMKKLKKRIKQLEDDRKKLEKQLADAAKQQEEGREKLRNQLQKELDKPKRKRDEKLIARLRKQLQGGGDPREEIKAQIEDNKAETKKFRQELSKQTSLRDALRDPISTVLRERKDATESGVATLLDELRTVQGGGVTMDQITGTPPLGTLSGEIGEVQLALRDLGLKDENAEARDPMSISELLEFANAISLGAFRNSGPFMGAFAKGGVALVGEQGAELAHLPSGTRVHSAADTKKALAPVVQISFAGGMEWIEQFMEVKIDGKMQSRDRKNLGKWRAGTVPR